jgi:transaldolase
MKQNPLRRLSELGQSPWLDYIRRDLISGGELQRLISEDGLRGMTSNPAIFEKAITSSNAYEKDIRALAAQGKSVQAIYDALSLSDVGAAADAFRPLHETLNGWEGYVSLEVNPHLAYDAPGTIAEARRLWTALKRPNVLIKVPATAAGLVAIRQLISEGINVNVTLLFGLPRYRAVAEAYIAGLQDRAAKGLPLKSIASVASFFVSRIDALIDPLLKKTASKDGGKAKLAMSLEGQVAIASARVAYQTFKEIFGGRQFRALGADGAHPQRLLWASTSTKDPAYSDVKYVEALIGVDTINTLPMETLDAYRDHGIPELRLERDLDQARGVMSGLSQVGIDIDKITQQLEDEGVEKFNKPFDMLLKTLSKESAQAR